MSKSPNKGKNTNNKKNESHERFNPLGGYPGFKGLRAAGTVHSVIGQSTVGAVVTANGVAPAYYGKYFTIGELDNFSSLSAVFDQYRITKIDCWLLPSITNVTDGTQTVPEIYSAVDIDDGATPASVSQLYQYESTVASKALCGHYHSWVPRASLAAYGTAGFVSSANVVSPWIDCSSSSVQHYGIKVAITAGSPPIKYDLIFRIHADFQSLH